MKETSKKKWNYFKGSRESLEGNLLADSKKTETLGVNDTIATSERKTNPEGFVPLLRLCICSVFVFLNIFLCLSNCELARCIVPQEQTLFT